MRHDEKKNEKKNMRVVVVDVVVLVQSFSKYLVSILVLLDHPIKFLMPKSLLE